MVHCCNKYAISVKPAVVRYLYCHRQGIVSPPCSVLFQLLSNRIFDARESIERQLCTVIQAPLTCRSGTVLVSFLHFGCPRPLHNGHEGWILLVDTITMPCLQTIFVKGCFQCRIHVCILHLDGNIQVRFPTLLGKVFRFCFLREIEQVSSAAVRRLKQKKPSANLLYLQGVAFKRWLKAASTVQVE